MDETVKDSERDYSGSAVRRDSVRRGCNASSSSLASRR